MIKNTGTRQIKPTHRRNASEDFMPDFGLRPQILRNWGFTSTVNEVLASVLSPAMALAFPSLRNTPDSG
jgi:hypothetical protein